MLIINDITSMIWQEYNCTSSNNWLISAATLLLLTLEEGTYQPMALRVPVKENMHIVFWIIIGFWMVGILSHMKVTQVKVKKIVVSWFPVNILR